MHIDREGQSFDVRELGAGPTLILVHGYPLDGGMWSGVARILSSEFRVLKPDLPGRPENPLPAAGTISRSVEFLAALVSASPPPVGIAGFSMGGYAVLGLLRDHPAGIGAVALIDTRASGDDEAGRAKREEAIASLQAGGPAAVAEAMIPKLLSAEARSRADVVERVRRTILRQSSATLQADLEAMRDRPDQTSFLAQIAVPTLVVSGEHDQVTSSEDARRMADAIPEARFVEIPGAGHATPIERPRGVAAALAAFFRSTLAAPPASGG
ncbi:MAG: alpha/beta fold hydrolase [Acidobacteriota bacterium]